MEISKNELRERVLYSLMAPVATLARVFRTPLKDLTQWLQMAYFHQLRGSGHRMQEIAEFLEISMRTTARLSTQLKQNFLRPDSEHALPRRIEFMLWAAPLSEARLRQVLGDETASAVRKALDVLLDERRIIEQPGRVVTYAVTSATDRLIRDSWQTRIGGMNALLNTIANAIFLRFFGADAALAFARNVSFRVRREDLPELHAIYETQVWERLKQLDEAAQGDADSIPLSLALCWAPYEFLKRQGDQSE